MATAFAGSGFAGPDGHMLFGVYHIGIYDAVITITGGYEPFAYRAARRPNASVEAAVAAAGRALIAKLIPAQASVGDAAYEAALAAVPDGAAKTEGIAVGEAAAAAALALPFNAGLFGPQTYVAPDPPVAGRWIPAAPPARPLGPYIPHLTPLSFAVASQFRPAGPPALTSAKWAADFAEVSAWGSKTSAFRSADQTAAATFYSENPTLQPHLSLRKFVTDRNLGVAESARLFAMASVAFTDSLVACFEAKYHYAFWRPSTAIRAGATDGNDATIADPAWEALLANPNHPEYPSAHACLTTTEALVIKEFAGSDRIEYTKPSLVADRPARHYVTAEQLIAEVGNARVWGGIHYRSAVEDGTLIGRQVFANLVATRFRVAGTAPAPAPPSTGTGVSDDSSSPVPFAVLTLVPVLAGAAWLVSRRRLRPSD